MESILRDAFSISALPPSGFFCFLFFSRPAHERKEVQKG
jgi:hypothetical protein